MRIFDTDVQKLKYQVLREVARYAYDDKLTDCYLEIPKTIAPGPQATMRCCVYKERAIAAERVRIAMGGDKANPHIIEVIDIACDECPVSAYEVGSACRGCLAHRCQAACPRGAISFEENKKAKIDPDKCIQCGKCASVCPYNAITINYNKCISCGSCVYMCPFGAVVDKSFILDAVKLIRESENNTKYHVYAVVAPSISSQFRYAKIGQVITALKKLGFYNVIEAALGADMVAYSEARELVEKGFLTSSCCPAFVDFIKKNFPKMVEHISHNFSPMVAMGEYIKKTDPEGKVVFIGPCTAKKAEAQLEKAKPFVDCVLTFEELQALIDSRDFDITQLEEDVLDNASYYGRIFARSGGLSESVAQALKEQGLDHFEVRPLVCDGIEACKAALLKANVGKLTENFIEGMSCSGGCIGGAGCLTHGAKDKSEVDKYGMEAYEKTIGDALKMLP